MKIKIGDRLKCISAKSNFYSLGSVYVVEKNPEGDMCVRGSDGLLDPLARMASKFELIPQMRIEHLKEVS